MLLNRRIKSCINKYPFETGVIIFFAVYIALCLTPSSYGLVLNMFGHGGEGLLWGSPRAIRSDEWAVWTPYFQSLVNNDFSRINEQSLYSEDFRGFSALPIYDWAFVFKPLLWPFLVFSEAYAFSFHHALIMIMFVIGWKQLIDQLFPLARENFISGFFSLLIFFSGFVQGWWTTLGPVLALTPWLFIVLLRCEKITLVKALTFSYISIAWLLSHTYPPIIISSVYVAIVLVFAFKRELINTKTVVGLILASGIALAVVYMYFFDAIQIMSQTVYPGKRISRGGAVPWEMWVSAFIPYITHSNYQPLLSTNICELGVVSSLLPMIVLSFLRYRSVTKENLKVIAIFFVFLAAMSWWMLAPLSPLMAKLILLDQIPGSRLIWAFGITLNILCLYILISCQLRFNWQRITIFSLILMSSYAGSCYYYDLLIGKKSAWELIAIPLLIGGFFYSRRMLLNNRQLVALLIAIAVSINVIYFGGFNPGQSAKPIFELKNSPAINALKEKQYTHPNGWLVVSGYPGAILQGLGLNAVTHVLMMPKLEFFRELFPQMDEKEFSRVFNRYAHIHLSDDPVPNSPQADVIRIPKSIFKVKEEPSIKVVNVAPVGNRNGTPGGYVDSVVIDGDEVKLIGWGMISSKESSFLSNSVETFSASLERITRPDVVGALNNNKLFYSGFQIKFRLPNSVSLDQFCLYTEDPIFGIKKIMPGNPDMLYKCANK